MFKGSFKRTMEFHFNIIFIWNNSKHLRVLYKMFFITKRYLVNTINKLQQLPEWKNMAIVIIYDDTDGDYDHQIPPKSQTEVVNGHRGFGGRVPMLLISPWSKVNYVDHTQLDQSSIAKFI